MKRTLLISVSILIAVAAALRGQIPSSFSNLQAFDGDLSRQDLVGVMRSWATALGVRCSHCHVGPDDLVGMDFATDEKPAKRTARRMYAMAQRINRELRSGLPTREAGDRPGHVTCYTCHRGLPRPPVESWRLLDEIVRNEGIDAALARFDRLRTEHAGSGAYDLSAAALHRVAQRALERDAPDQAIAALERNRELFPDDGSVLVRLALVQASAGRIDAAKASVARALELTPDDPSALQLAQRLGVAVPER